MNLVFLGMSGAGKSTWSSRLEQFGYSKICCDSLIADRLRDVYQIEMIQTIDNLSDWLGMPDDPAFYERERLFQQCENEVLFAVIDAVAADQNPESRYVIDMGGSSIYCGEELFARSRAVARIVYLKITPQVHAQMLEAYLQNPRPLMWHGMYDPRPDESREAAFRRSYSNLIRYRESQYERFSDVQLEYEFHRKDDVTVAEFLAAVAH